MISCTVQLKLFPADSRAYRKPVESYFKGNGKITLDTDSYSFLYFLNANQML
jgi:hypothetical protein